MIKVNNINDVVNINNINIINNTINIDHTKLATYISALKMLRIQTVMLSAPISESLGQVANQEQQIMEDLKGICQRDIPLLLENTEKLLVAIYEEFIQSDMGAKDIFTRK